MQAFEKYWVLNSWKWRFFNFWNRNGQKRGVSWWFSVDVRFPNHDWINQLIKISRPRLGFSTRRININIIFVNSMTDILRLPMKMIAKKNMFTLFYKFYTFSYILKMLFSFGDTCASILILIIKLCHNRWTLRMTI